MTDKNKEIIQQANQKGLPFIPLWLPEGKKEGEEWVALNPTRNDSSPGSFKINLNTGIWAEFAGNGQREKGDVVGLYAYINGINSQVEAAKKILCDADPLYFPDIEPTKEKKDDPWSGFEQLNEVPANIANLDLSWYRNKFGEVSGKWSLKWPNGKEAMRIVRFIKDGKKDDRPFTAWANGTQTKWRMKSLKCKLPFFGCDSIDNSKEFLLVEGQKCWKDAKEIVGDTFSVVSWYGGSNRHTKTDWSALKNDKVYYWPDNDDTGFKTIAFFKQVFKEIVVCKPPIGVKQGWDISDAIKEGWDKKRIINFINCPNETETIDNGLISEMPFDIIGISGPDIYFYPKESCVIMKYRGSSLTKTALMSLADRSIWGSFYQRPENGGIAWDAAINDILRAADKAPFFDKAVVRRAGAWFDGKEVVINNGNELIIKGNRLPFAQKNGRYWYEKSKHIPYDELKPMTTGEATLLTEVLKLIGFRHVASAAVLSGWILLSIWCGILRWRPHIWLTGPKGTGKTYILEEIVYPLVGNRFGVNGKGSSTPAGVRQALDNCAIPAIMDEMESDNKQYASYIDQNLKIFRESSSGCKNVSATLHGTSDGEGKQWIVQSMACFASIGAAIRHGADADRFTVITLRKFSPIAQAREEQYRQLEEKVKALTEDWAIRFHSRTYKLIDELLESIRIFVDEATAICGNRRSGDQIGTLIAGNWMIGHDKAPSNGEARDYLNGLEVATLNGENEVKADEELLLDEIFSYQLEFFFRNRVKMSIGAALYQFFNESIGTSPESIENSKVDKNKIKDTLEQIGIKPVSYNGKYLLIAHNHTGIKKMLIGTPWEHIYGEMLSRLDFCEPEIMGPGVFAGVRKRYRKLCVAQYFTDSIPF